ncbi:TldD protein [Klebsiella pneumoniae subsp. ozaenae]|uniref:TldD protein n=1 Tax=Klebsiella pneumoniae subsp. ozaenae TaxID=574 RepID=A0A377YXE9_KLEPO|nr:TldD protein [Klebsiella pneumoniae subsp. ozaenae]
MSLNLVSEQLLSANGLNHQDLFAILGQLTERRLDYGDLYFQSSYHESWVLEDSIIKDGSYNIDQGVGVRAVSGEKTGFAYADQISKLALEQSAQAARTIVRDTGNGKVQTLGAVEHRALYTSIDPLQSMTREEKLDILRRVDKVARAADQRVQEVSASLSGVYELILVAATDGTLAADVRPLVRLSVSVLVEEDGKRERGSSGGGGRFGYDYFLASQEGDVRPMPGRKKRCAWRWSTSRRSPPLRGCCRWCSAPAGLASCCMKRSAMGWKAISTGVAPRSLAAIWGN